MPGITLAPGTVVVQLVFDRDYERWWIDSPADQAEAADDPIHYRAVPADLADRYFAAYTEFDRLQTEMLNAAGVHVDSEALVDPCGQFAPDGRADIPEAWIVERDGQSRHAAASQADAEAWIAALPDTMMERGRGGWIVVHRADFTVTYRAAVAIGGRCCVRCGNSVDDHGPATAGVDG